MPAIAAGCFQSRSVRNGLAFLEGDLGPEQAVDANDGIGPECRFAIVGSDDHRLRLGRGDEYHDHPENYRNRLHPEPHRSCRHVWLGEEIYSASLRAKPAIVMPDSCDRSALALFILFLF